MTTILPYLVYCFVKKRRLQNVVLYINRYYFDRDNEQMAFGPVSFVVSLNANSQLTQSNSPVVKKTNIKQTL